MSASNVLKLMKDKEIEYVDLRFTDPRGKYIVRGNSIIWRALLIPEISVEPVIPYKMLKPNNMSPDAKDPKITYFKEASFDSLSFFNIPARI